MTLLVTIMCPEQKIYFFKSITLLTFILKIVIFLIILILKH